ncbi:hypothetical protein [Polaromonas sp.]|uniref:SWIM zinc finger family protein n=1 Tax=Polaromonas sp. TaxID=1869339 RepID=UPI003BB6EFC0
MNYGQWPAYVSVAERRAKAEKAAEKAAAKAKKAGTTLTPIAPFRGAIAKTFWGKAWCDNLENYSDYANRLPRGSSYVRNGSVIDLQITPGEVRAQVMGSSLYTVTASVTAVPEKQWKTICTDCSGSIDSLVELLQGKLSNAVMERICKPGSGLFPSPKEISFECSCPDWASMCKHVAAVLYGIGARLDQQPEVLFTLRRVDAKDLVSQASQGLPVASKRPATGKVLDDAQLADMFGIEMADVSAPAKPAAGAKTSAGKKSATGKVALKAPAKPRQSASSKVAAPAAKKAANPPATPKARKVATNSARARPIKDKTD